MQTIMVAIDINMLSNAYWILWADESWSKIADGTSSMKLTMTKVCSGVSFRVGWSLLRSAFGSSISPISFSLSASIPINLEFSSVASGANGGRSTWEWGSSSSVVLLLSGLKSASICGSVGSRSTSSSSSAFMLRYIEEGDDPTSEWVPSLSFVLEPLPWNPSLKN